MNIVLHIVLNTNSYCFFGELQQVIIVIKHLVHFCIFQITVHCIFWLIAMKFGRSDQTGGRSRVLRKFQQPQKDRERFRKNLVDLIL